jgi:phosphoserine phosphatase RsbU/P
MPLSRLLALNDAVRPAPENGVAAVNPAIFDRRILIVDDVATNREIIATYLGREGYWNLEFAEDGADALEKVAGYAPDLLILDIVMPRLDGIEVCRRLRRMPETSRLPILVQTSLDESAERAEIFRAGATDLVSRPFNRYELLARVAIHLDRGLLIEGLRQYHDRTQQDLYIARTMQQGLLPSTLLEGEIAARHGLRIASHVTTSSELGGDFWGIRELGDGRVGVFIVDFSGHGVAAAMNTFRLHTLVEELAPLMDDPDHFLAALNLRLANLLMPGQFATMLHGVLDTREKRFRYASAGAPPPLFRPGRDRPVESLDSAGVPLGITSRAEYPCREMPFEPGALLFLYSDALIEAADENGRRAGDGRLRETLAICSDDATPQEVVECTCEVMLRDAAAPLLDDLTVICIAAI